MIFSKSDKVEKLVFKHMAAVEQCLDVYMALWPAYHHTDEVAKMKVALAVDQLESDADVIRHDIIHELFESGLLLESRKHLMSLIEKIDNIANLAEDVTRNLVYQRVPVSEVHIAVILKMNEVTWRQWLLLKEVIVPVLTTYHTNEMMGKIRAIEEMESEVDHIQNEGIISLYRSELMLAEMNQIRDLYNLIGNVSDVIEDISDLIEIMMLSRRA